MGYLRHKALLVNSWSKDKIEAAHNAVSLLYAEGGMAQLVSPVLPHVMNGGASFFIAPDGSKEGWDHSDASDALMERAIVLMQAMDYVDWCEVICGGDDDVFEVTASSGDVS